MMANQFPQAASVDPQEVVDISFVKQVESSAAAKQEIPMLLSLVAAINFIYATFAGFTCAVRAAESTALERINFGFSAAGSVASAPLWMAQDSGAFKKYGLDVKLISSPAAYRRWR
jgi:hypothetical protein